MCFLVAPEIARCAEGLEAAVAGVWLVLDVGHPVVVKVGAGSEALSTGLTLVRPFPSVNPSVCVQGGAGGESLVTELAGVGSFPCVGPHMSLQQRGSVEHLSTVGARDCLLAQPFFNPLLLLLFSSLWSGGGGQLVLTARASVSRGEGVGRGREE